MIGIELELSVLRVKLGDFELVSVISFLDELPCWVELATMRRTMDLSTLLSALTHGFALRTR